MRLCWFKPVVTVTTVATLGGKKNLAEWISRRKGRFAQLLDNNSDAPHTKSCGGPHLRAGALSFLIVNKRVALRATFRFYY